MATFKVDVRFGAGKYGWKETWYLTSGLTIKDVGTVVIDKFCPVRQKGLGTGARIESIRLTIEEQPGISRLLPFSAEELVQNVVGESTRDNAFAGYLMHVYDADRQYRRIWVPRALPDGWCQRDFRGEERMHGDSITWFQEFGAMMRTFGFKFKANEKVPFAAEKVVANVAFEGATGYLLAHVPAHGFQGNGRVKIRRASGVGVRYINGTRQAQVVDSDNIRLLPAVPAGVTVRYDGDGRLSLKTPIYPRFDVAIWQRYAKRDTGRPFDLTRGRARNRSQTA